MNTKTYQDLKAELARIHRKQLEWLPQLHRPGACTILADLDIELYYVKIELRRYQHH